MLHYVQRFRLIQSLLSSRKASQHGFWCLCLSAFFVPTLSMPIQANNNYHNADPWALCPLAIVKQEQKSAIPPFLLHAISLIESGRLAPDKTVRAWPWTVMAQGKGRYYKTKREAVNAVKRLKKQGVRNIDVGCMQVNLKYHPKAFKNLEEAFDPYKNTAYSAKFLTDLRRDYNSWTKAVGYYHSREHIRSKGYRNKVLKAWRKERLAATAPNARAYLKKPVTLPADRDRPALTRPTTKATRSSGSKTQLSALPSKKQVQSRMSREEMILQAYRRHQAFSMQHETLRQKHQKKVDSYRQYLDQQFTRLKK